MSGSTLRARYEDPEEALWTVRPLLGSSLFDSAWRPETHFGLGDAVEATLSDPE